MVWLALLGAVIVGLSLGLLVSGGSILTVPLLVDLVGASQRKWPSPARWPLSVASR